jgi:hypothetical protein
MTRSAKRVLAVSSFVVLFAATQDRHAWKPDRTCVAILEALVPRVPELDAEVLREIVFLLERFLDSGDAEAALVLSLVERILQRALREEAGGSAWGVISECLALSISLRLALPGEAHRAHALFEKALAADVPAATDALDTMDGRDRYHPPRHYPRPRRRVGRARRRGRLRF